MDGFTLVREAVEAIKRYGVTQAKDYLIAEMKSQGMTKEIDQIFPKVAPVEEVAPVAQTGLSPDAVDFFVDDPAEALRTLRDAIGGDDLKSSAASELLDSILDKLETVEITVLGE